MASNQDTKKTVMHEPGFKLKDKIGKNVDLSKLFTPEKIKACEAEIETARTDFLRLIDERLSEMESIIADDIGENRKQQLIQHSFSIKGQAESLGYLMIALTARSAGSYLEDYYANTEEDRTVMQKHLETLQAAVRGNIKGDGGETGRALVKNLQLLIQKYHPQPG